MSTPTSETKKLVEAIDGILKSLPDPTPPPIVTPLGRKVKDVNINELDEQTKEFYGRFRAAHLTLVDGLNKIKNALKSGDNAETLQSKIKKLLDDYNTTIEMTKVPEPKSEVQQKPTDKLKTEAKPKSKSSSLFDRLSAAVVNLANQAGGITQESIKESRKPEYNAEDRDVKHMHEETRNLCAKLYEKEKAIRPQNKSDTKANLIADLFKSLATLVNKQLAKPEQYIRKPNATQEPKHQPKASMASIKPLSFSQNTASQPPSLQTLAKPSPQQQTPVTHPPKKSSSVKPPKS